MSSSSEHPIVVLLIDDQEIIAQAVQGMLEEETDVRFYFCSDPTEAIGMANDIQPTVILQDLVMPEVDGLLLVKFLRANPATRDTPLIVLSSKEEPVIKAEAFARGANDYLVKLPDKVELVARIRHHSAGYIHLLERNEAYTALEESRQKLAEQMAAASKYLRSLLPKPFDEPFKVDWRFIPTADLGGDTFGYHWIDDDHFAMYLVDVAGHGLDSALLSVTIMNVLRSRSFLQTNFRQPGEVLGALNDGFPMEKHGDKCFTIWYGVYQPKTRMLSWSGGGHPEGLLFEPGIEQPIGLASDGPMMGMMPWPAFAQEEREIKPGSRIYIYSDGVHEIHRVDEDGTEWPFEEFRQYMATTLDNDESPMDQLLKHARKLNGSDLLDDDYSIVEACF